MPAVERLGWGRAWQKPPWMLAWVMTEYVTGGLDSGSHSYGGWTPGVRAPADQCLVRTPTWVQTAAFSACSYGREKSPPQGLLL